MRANGDWPPVMNTRFSQDDGKPNVQCGQVLSDRQNEPTTNWPTLTFFTSLPISVTIPQYSWPMCMGSLTSFAPRYGQRSEPQMQLAERRMIASVGSMMRGSSTSSNRTSRG